MLSLKGWCTGARTENAKGLAGTAEAHALFCLELKATPQLFLPSLATEGMLPE